MKAMEMTMKMMETESWIDDSPFVIYYSWRCTKIRFYKLDMQSVFTI